MRIEISLDRNLTLPAQFEQKLQAELTKRLGAIFDEPDVIVKRGAAGISILRGNKGDRDLVEEVLQATWESADDWFDTEEYE
ncbi:MAG: DinI-like family protein [Plesiomonas sp.]|uniref:DinI-like family protein n=1 Tax=Plesiomonas sp. TaxID=2486279 RepID=UPI003F34D101